jgi:hypothetical protein
VDDPVPTSVTTTTTSGSSGTGPSMIDAATGDPSNPDPTDDSPSSSRSGVPGDDLSSAVASGSSNISDGKWHLVVLSTTPTTTSSSQSIIGPVLRQPGYKLYIDGVLTAELTGSTAQAEPGGTSSTDSSRGTSVTGSSGSGTDGGDPLYMAGAPAVICGRADGDVSRSFQGSVTQLMLFGRSLSNADVSNLYLSSFLNNVLPTSSSSRSGGSSSMMEGLHSDHDPSPSRTFYPTSSMHEGDTGGVTSDTRSDNFGPGSATGASGSPPAASDSSNVSPKEGPLIVAAQGPSDGSSSSLTSSSSGSSSSQSDESSLSAAPSPAGLQWDLPEGSGCDLEPMTVRSPRYCEGGQVRHDR